MSRIWGKFSGLFRSKTLAGMDKSGNQYYVRTEQIDGIMKEKRWVVFKAEDDPTSIPVEWICWLNGQRKRAPTPEEIAALEARREHVKLNVALLKKEEEERRAKHGNSHIAASISKAKGPDLKSFIQQFPDASEGEKVDRASDPRRSERSSKQAEAREKEILHQEQQEQESSEPTGSGQSFRPGTWQPPT